MRRELKLKLARLRAKMDALCSPLDPDRKDERLAQAAQDDDAFGRLYVPHWCSQTTPEFHHELSAGFDLRGCEIQAYAAPRNHAKTTRALMRIAREICFAQRKRITMVSASEDLAEDIFEPLRITLSENPRIIQDFGELIKTNDGGAFRTSQLGLEAAPVVAERIEIDAEQGACLDFLLIGHAVIFRNGGICVG